LRKEPPGGVRCYRYHHDADAKEQTYFVTLRCVAGSRFRTLAACITVMNALQRNAMPEAAFWRTSVSSKGWHVQWETVPPG
jgi:hypothetical protein